MDNEIKLNGKEYVLKTEQKDTKNNTCEDNSGFLNSGNWNSGNGNSGNRNSGDWNSGNWNSGYRNSGNWNSGNGNSGNRNSGYWNSGSRNSGNWNSGNWNSGNWNSGNGNSGYCNTDILKIRIFNQETDVKLKDIDFPTYFHFDFNEWIVVDDMTDKEKEEFYWYKTTEGYLRTQDYKEAWKKSFESADKEDVAKTLKLPNFDYKLFEEISGITKEMLDIKLKYKKCKVCGK